MERPNLYIMIGLPGSGKDSVANEIRKIFYKANEDFMVLSSDTIRNELFGWEDQTKNGKVFETMNRRCMMALKDGVSVVYNATNLSRKRRKNIISMAQKYADVNAVLCLAPIGTVLERNLTRYERHLPEEKLLQMFKTMDVPFKYEGFKHIYYINTEDRFNKQKFIDWLFDLGKGYNQLSEYHNATVQDHLIITAKYAWELSKDYVLWDAGRFHDIAKPYSREYNEEKGKYTYYEHHKMSAYLYLLYTTYDAGALNQLKEIPDNILETTELIYHHMDKFVGNLEKTEQLLGKETYKKLKVLMEADAYREE